MKKLLTQMRNEWRSNLWLALELLLVSIVLWFCVDRIVDYVSILNEPRGHDISHVYKITPARIPGMESERPDYENMAEMLERIRRRPEVEYAALSRFAAPYCGSTNNVNVWQDDSIAPIYSSGNAIRRWVQPDFFKVYRIRGVRGETPDQLAEILLPGTNIFGATPGLLSSNGQTINTVDHIGETFDLNGYPDHKLAAVTEPMKRFDYTRLEYCEPTAWDMMVPVATPRATEISVRLKPEMDSQAFIDDIMNDSESQLRVGPYFILKVERLSDLRRSAQMSWTINNRNYLLGVIFLLVNIFLGMLGIFWYRTQMRVSDIAVLKVFGATNGSIFRRLIGEGLLILCIVTPPAILCEWLLISKGYIRLSAEFGSSLTFNFMHQIVVIPLICFALLALIIVAGIYYPARRAMKLAPALALRSE